MHVSHIRHERNKFFCRREEYRLQRKEKTLIDLSARGGPIWEWDDRKWGDTGDDDERKGGAV